MRTEAIVMQPAAFAQWLRSQTKAVASPNPSISGAAIFNDNGCGSCHTLTAAHSTGTIGPDLDKLQTYAQRAGKPLAAFVQQSIVDPSAYVQPGYPDHVMPGTFGTQLTKTQIDALVAFLVQSAQKTGNK
jgi:cytochrome c oxidase subunit 2